MTRRGKKFLTCPDCGKRGVWMHLSSEDGWKCRYCGFWAYANGEDNTDRWERQRLAAANPQADIWVTSLDIESNPIREPTRYHEGKQYN